MIKPYTIDINPALYKKSNQSMLHLSKKAEMAYTTMFRMCQGKWEIYALKTLARFLWALGIPKTILEEMKISEIFTIKIQEEENHE